MEEHGTITLCLDILQHASKEGHEDVTYVLSLLLHRSNGHSTKDDNAPWLLRKVKGDEGPPVPYAMWKNKNMVPPICHAAVRGTSYGGM